MILALAALLLGCTPPEETGRRRLPPPTLPTGTPVTTTDSGHTGLTTGTTATTTYDCSTPWPDPLGVRQVGNAPSSEDFDITADGMIVHIEGSNLVERSMDGLTVNLIAPNVADNAAGTRVLRNGDVVVADVGQGALVRVDRATGTRTPLLARNWPNGIDVDAEDYVYVSDFSDNGSVTRVNAYDATDQQVLAENMERPNGIALSPDGQTLYIAANWENEIWAIDRNTDGTWGTVRIFQANPGSPQSVTTDVCGTVYWEKFSEVWRKRADGSDGGPVANAAGGYFPNLRFGNDMGGFARDSLYGLSNDQVHEFNVGVPGKKHISLQ